MLRPSEWLTRRSQKDPDQALFRRAARRIALQVAALSAFMVIAGAALLLGYMWVDAKRGHRGKLHFDSFEMELDGDDLVEVLLVVGIGVVVLAWVGATLFARRAIAPLEEAMARQRSFIGDASHELRTPLAVMSARTQQLQLMVGGDQELQAVVTDLRKDTQEMTEIVNDLLTSVSQAGDSDVGASVAETLSAVGSDLSVLAAERGVALQFQVERQPVVAAPPVPFRRAVSALVDNAIKYAPENGSVQVSAGQAGRKVLVLVRDNGPGITGIEPDGVFEKFARGAPPEGEQGRPGHGIGLALVRDVALRYGGSVEVRETGPSGTVLSLTLPALKGESHE